MGEIVDFAADNVFTNFFGSKFLENF